MQTYTLVIILTSRTGCKQNRDSSTQSGAHTCNAFGIRWGAVIYYWYRNGLEIRFRKLYHKSRFRDIPNIYRIRIYHLVNFKLSKEDGCHVIHVILVAMRIVDWLKWYPPRISHFNRPFPKCNTICRPTCLPSKELLYYYCRLISTLHMVVARLDKHSLTYLTSCIVYKLHSNYWNIIIYNKWVGKFETRR